MNPHQIHLNSPTKITFQDSFFCWCDCCCLICQLQIKFLWFLNFWQFGMNRQSCTTWISCQVDPLSSVWSGFLLFQTHGLLDIWWLIVISVVSFLGCTYSVSFSIGLKPVSCFDIHYKHKFLLRITSSIERKVLIIIVLFNFVFIWTNMLFFCEFGKFINDATVDEKLFIILLYIYRHIHFYFLL